MLDPRACCEAGALIGALSSARQPAIGASERSTSSTTGSQSGFVGHAYFSVTHWLPFQYAIPMVPSDWFHETDVAPVELVDALSCSPASVPK